MSISEELDLTRSGIIEASAGTGKTYTITNLVVRLVLGFQQSISDVTDKENYILDPIPLENILISTFTRAATEELRSRIAGALVNTRECFEVLLALNCDLEGSNGNIRNFNFDEFIVSLGLFLVAKAKKEGKGRDAYLKNSIRLLQIAENKVDLAPIKTMHGFCQSVLRDHAFESGAMFRTTILEDDTQIQNQAAIQFSRDFLYGGNKDFTPVLGYLYSSVEFSEVYKKTGVYRIEDIESDVIDGNDGNRHMVFDIKNFSGLYNQLNSIYQEMISIIPWYENNVTQELVKDVDSIKRNNQSKKIFKLAGSGLSANGYIKFVKSVVNNEKDNNCDILDDADKRDKFVTLLQELIAWKEEKSQEFKLQIKLWKIFIADQIRLQIARFKEENNFLGFDDIIKNMHYAITKGTSCEKLVASLRKRYPVAILDEFQDTDRYQYEIFSKIYLEPDSQSNLRLLVIGDPKQAIYSFRSADVYTYLKARDEIEKNGILTSLDTNYRSNPGLVKFVNVLFGDNRKESRPFSRKDSFKIIYQNSKTKYELDDFQGTEEVLSCNTPPLYQFPISDDEDNILPSLLISNVADDMEKATKTDLLPVKSRLCALHVDYLLKNSRFISRKSSDSKEKKLKPGDIAVLVSDGSQADLVKTDLKNIGIDSVYLSDRSEVTQSNLEIEFFSDFMQCLLDVERREFAIRLYANPLLMKSLTEIENFSDSAADYGKYQDLLRSCRKMWDDRNFMAAFMQFIVSPQILLVCRLMCSSSGDRLLTNVFHLAEIIQNKSIHYPSPLRLKKWFDDIKSHNPQDLLEGTEETSTSIRLETQKDLVRIVTIHSSKGLEYPVVMMPFANPVPKKAKTDQDNKFYTNHIIDKNSEPRLVLDVSYSDGAAQESQEELIRLLYVAVTRAKVLLWMDIASPKNNSDGIQDHEYPAIVNLLRNKLKGQDGNNVSLENGYLSLKDFCNYLNQVQGFDDFNSLRFDPRDYLKDNRNPDPECISMEIGSDKVGEIINEQICQSEIFTKHIDRSWEITSFSRLSSIAHKPVNKYLDQEKEAEAQKSSRENDEGEIIQDNGESETGSVEETSTSYKLDRFHFPRGTKPGSFLHQILEDIHPLRPEETQNPAAVENLRNLMKQEVEKSFFASSRTLEKWTDEKGIQTLTDWFRLITETPLDFGDRRFALNEIDPEWRLPEVPFIFSMGKLMRSELDNFLLEYAKRKEWVDFSDYPLNTSSDTFPINGFLRGVIDLLFCYQGRYYILDYKSNYISGISSEYDDQHLQDAIVKHRYDLQYAIYSLAAWRFLKRRIPDFDFERDFGGVLYLFIRGLPDKNSGAAGSDKFVTGCFFRKMPGNDFIQGLDRIFEDTDRRED